MTNTPQKKRSATTHDSIEKVATSLRKQLKDTGQKEGKKIILLFAYNGTGKTRLSMAFKEQGQHANAMNSGILAGSGEPLVTKKDTLYFNAFTEDLFFWDNDLEENTDRHLKFNKASRFFSGLEGLAIEKTINEFLQRYVDFDFKIDYINSRINFNLKNNPDENIKISRGEENIFIWCFFLALVELAMDEEINAYSWVDYVYIDDPISSLDENNAVAIAHQLAQLLKGETTDENKEENKDKKKILKAVISTHHTLFFNVLYNEFYHKKNTQQYFLNKDKTTTKYTLRNTGDTPFFYHIAMLAELKKAAETKKLYTYHFNILRNILEKTAGFHGQKKFSDCIPKNKDDPDGLHARQINILNHGKYSMYEPVEMLPENKTMFCKILDNFLEDYKFNTKVLAQLDNATEQQNTEVLAQPDNTTEQQK